MKFFTRAEAKKTLPLVKKIVDDIIAEGQEIRRIGKGLESDAIRENAEIKSRLNKLEGFLQELQEIGCYYKDWNFGTGLVDFPAVINGREVLLCWRSDEEDILFYHDNESGYAGRQPIPVLN